MLTYLHSRKFSKRWVFRVVWSWSWCFRKGLNYRLTRWKRWSRKLCSKISSQWIFEENMFQRKSSRFDITVQCRHLVVQDEKWRIMMAWMSRCHTIPPLHRGIHLRFPSIAIYKIGTTHVMFRSYKLTIRAFGTGSRFARPVSMAQDLQLAGAKPWTPLSALSHLQT